MIRAIQPAAAPPLTTTVVGDLHTCHVPEWVRDLDSFRRWVRSADVPKKLRVCYLNGDIWIDLTMEQAFWHNQVKNEFNFVLTGLCKESKQGRWFPDGMLLTNESADLACEPDGVFVSREGLRAGTVRLVEGQEAGFVELAGTPEMVLEVVSTGSETKDEVRLRDLYWKAGVPEYWLVDARGDKLLFTILRRTPKGYVPARKQGGWSPSAVLGKSFRLTRQTDELGHPAYTLAVR